MPASLLTPQFSNLALLSCLVAPIGGSERAGATAQSCDRVGYRVGGVQVLWHSAYFARANCRRRQTGGLGERAGVATQSCDRVRYEQMAGQVSWRHMSLQWYLDVL